MVSAVRCGILTSIVTLVLSGCGTSAPVRYYGLTAVETNTVVSAPAEFAISVGPFRLAEYLNRSQIVTRGEDVRITLAEFDRWTEPLGRAFQRTVSDNLAALLGSDRVLDFPAQSEMSVGYQLPGQITRFDSDEAGVAVLEVQWLIKDLDENQIVPARRSRYTGQVATPDDYASIVQTMSELIGIFSRDVATTLSKLP